MDILARCDLIGDDETATHVVVDPAALSATFTTAAPKRKKKGSIVITISDYAQARADYFLRMGLVP